jgi:hypothetical protein
MSEDRADRTPDPEEQGVPEGVFSHWEAVVEDMQATAEEYRADGWEVVELYPGDVTAMSGEAETVDEYGLDVVVPGEDARRVRRLVTAADAGFDSTSVFSAVAEGIVFLVVAVEDPDRGIVVLAPAYYDTDDPTTQDMLEAAVRNGEMLTHVRDLAGDAVSTFVHDDPELFAAGE